MKALNCTMAIIFTICAATERAREFSVPTLVVMTLFIFCAAASLYFATKQ